MNGSQANRPFISQIVGMGCRLPPGLQQLSTVADRHPWDGLTDQERERSLNALSHD
jgi:hypothetical protein